MPDEGDGFTVRTIEAIATSAAPEAIGPYSQAIHAGPLLFVSGQIGLDPATGILVSGGIAAETHQAFSNLDAILRAAGASLSSVVKATVYLADMAEFADMNAVYASHMPSPAPARSTVAVAKLPRNARVEIDVIAVI